MKLVPQIAICANDYPTAAQPVVVLRRHGLYLSSGCESIWLGVGAGHQGCDFFVRVQDKAYIDAIGQFLCQGKFYTSDLSLRHAA
jgi:hypothetical protein